MDELSYATSELKSEISAIKARLFNGMTDTMRETYARVLILENNREETDSRLHEMQKNIIAEFASHDTKEKIYHLIGIILVLCVISIFSGIVVIQLDWHHFLSFVTEDGQDTTLLVPPSVPHWSVVGP